MRFSDLTIDFPAAENRLYRRRNEIVRSGETIVDLVRGNVNEHGIVYPDSALREVLAQAAGQARTYKPNPLGQEPARAAIAAYYAPLQVGTDQILLTPGTSIAYWYCFKLLSEPGDDVLCPAPSYPLFDYIANLSGTNIRHYRLQEADDWTIDLDYLENQITTRTRAIIVISPHNPTGMVARAAQVADLGKIAERHALPIVFDEVFNEFVFEGSPPARPIGGNAPLVFTLNGFSKMFALPGMKVGWMVVSGDDSLARKAMTTLELISDTFLPVNEIAQFSVAGIFEAGQEFLKTYKQRVAVCRNAALSSLAGSSLVAPRGGFYLVLPYHRDIDEEELAIELLDEEKVLVHPGYFYDIEGRHLVLTFIQDPHVLTDALLRLKSHL
jgi:alanine-synthesizing transaminase